MERLHGQTTQHFFEYGLKRWSGRSHHAAFSAIVFVLSRGCWLKHRRMIVLSEDQPFSKVGL